MPVTEGCLNRTPTLPSLLAPSTTMLGGIVCDGVGHFFDGPTLLAGGTSPTATLGPSTRQERD